MEISLIGAASDLGVSVDGSSKAPELLLDLFENESSELISPAEPYFKSRDAGDKHKNEEPLNRLNADLYARTLSLKERGIFTIIIGGDHSCAIPSALSSAERFGNIGVIWIDAHTDFNTFRTTETGNIHGLPLACIAGYECGELRSFHRGNTVDPRNVCVIGARSIDSGEKENLKDAGVRVFTTEDLRKKDIRNIMDEAFSLSLDGTCAVHVSFDLDVIDPSDAPGVSVPEHDGITKEEALLINSIVAERISDICSYDLVEYNPLRDIESKTADVAQQLLRQIIPSAACRK